MKKRNNSGALNARIDPGLLQAFRALVLRKVAAAAAKAQPGKPLPNFRSCLEDALRRELQADARKSKRAAASK